MVAIFYSIFSFGSRYGANKVQLQWDAETAKYEQTLKEMEKQMTENETQHRKEQNRISNDLAESEKKYAVAIATNRAEYNDRLRESEKRASVYKSLSEAGAAERVDLARHTAELDRSLTEGIQLVEELSETIRLRDEQLILVGQQITNDRQLIGN